MLALAIAAPAAAQPPASPDPQQITVTGTRIPQRGGGVSPLLVTGAREIERAGIIRTEDFLNQLPQVLPSQQAGVNNGSPGVPGTATVDLRGLGPQRTLVLIDGKRLMPGDVTDGSIAPDLNFVPDALIDHIEIATGGQSAVYGSDAVAGAVNFVMKRSFTGLQLDLKGGGFSHTNGDHRIQGLLTDAGYGVPPRRVFDGLGGEATLTAGTPLGGDRGNLSAYVGYRRARPVAEGRRDFSRCALAASGPDLYCSGSDGSPATGFFPVLDPASAGDPVGIFTLDAAGPGNTLRDYRFGADAFNYASYQYLQRADTRLLAGLTAHYAIADAAELYGSASYMHDRTRAQLAPSGLFATQLSDLSCRNPLLSADEVAHFCTEANVPEDGTALLALARRFTTGPVRRETITHADYRLLGGVRGDVGSWHYDVSAQYARVSVHQSDTGDVSIARSLDAVNAVRAADGTIACASGHPGCVPLDIFSLDGVTTAAIDYVLASGEARGDTSETVIGANAARTLDDYGVRSPWAEEGVGIALGAEYRREGLRYAPDAEIASGDLASAGAGSPAVSGHFDVKELYGELRLPIAQHRGFPLDDLVATAGYRYSDYSNAGGSSTYKAGLEWAPIHALRLRTSFSHAVRAPNVVELFTPQALSFGAVAHDPCAGADPAATLPQATAAGCARTGVSAAQYGHIGESPVGYNALLGGNPRVRPERSNSWTIGFVAQPRRGVSLSIDYYRIAIAGLLSAPDPDTVLDQCVIAGDPQLCALIHRDPTTGSLWLTGQGYVDAVTQNLASRRTRGIDMDLSLDSGALEWRGHDVGRIEARLIGSYLLAFRLKSEPGAIAYDCTGYYGFLCGDPRPRWRHIVTVTWHTPWSLDLTLGWRFIDRVRIATSSPNPILGIGYDAANYRLGARHYLDLGMEWRLGQHLAVQAGVRNLLDRDPPIYGFDRAGGITSNGNTYTGFYDTLGRWIFLGLRVKM